jgi:uncharacterized membrane protein YidH (DUF202 family)
MTAFPGRDGLQPERTALAWQRTAITATVAMVPLIVVHARLGSWLMTGLGSAATAAAAVLVIVVHRRFAQLRDDESPFSPYLPMVGVALVTVLTALIGLLTALLLLLR